MSKPKNADAILVALDKVGRIAGRIVLETPEKPKHGTVYVSAALVAELRDALTAAGFDMDKARKYYKHATRRGREIADYDLELYAINTGEFYEKHRQLAREQRASGYWFSHVNSSVIPRYRAQVEHGEPCFASKKTISKVAAALAEYYTRQLAENGENRGAFRQLRGSPDSVECPHCHWGFAPSVIEQHIREKH